MKNGRYHISFFKINLLKALATKNTLPPLTPTEIPVDHFLP